MKFAVQRWVREKEMKITKIIGTYPKHPNYLKHHCVGCNAALAGNPWTAAWATCVATGKDGPAKLCEKCTEEAKAELSATRPAPQLDAILQTPQHDPLWA